MYREKRYNAARDEVRPRKASSYYDDDEAYARNRGRSTNGRPQRGKYLGNDYEEEPYPRHEGFSNLNANAPNFRPPTRQ